MNTNPHNIILRITFLSIFVIGIYACKTTKEIPDTGFDNGLFSIKNTACVETQNPDAIDSRVGTLTCGCITFNYDYGKYGYAGPPTVKEDFKKSFNVYHHTQFFKGLIDPKVYSIFLDSVNILDVRRKLDSDPLMQDCEQCNTTAVITFMGDTFFYPTTMSEKQLDQNDEDIKVKIIGEYTHKTYTDSKGQPATYISPLQNNFSKRNCLSMSIAESECSEAEVEKILNSIRITEVIN